MEAAREFWISREELMEGKRNLLQLVQELRGEFLSKSGFQWVEMMEERCRYLDGTENALGEYGDVLAMMAEHHLPAGAIVPHLPQTVSCKNEQRSRSCSGIPERLSPLRDKMLREADRFAMIQERSSFALNSLQALTKLPENVLAKEEMLREQLNHLQAVKDVLQMGVEAMAHVIELHRMMEEKILMNHL